MSKKDTLVRADGTFISLGRKLTKAEKKLVKKQRTQHKLRQEHVQAVSKRVGAGQSLSDALAAEAHRVHKLHGGA